MKKNENTGFFRNIYNELQGDHRKIVSSIKSSMEIERKIAESERYIKRIGEFRSFSFLEELKTTLDWKIGARAVAYDENTKILKSINRQVRKIESRGEYSGRLNVERERVAVKTKKQMPLLVYRLASSGLSTYLSSRKVDSGRLSIKDRIFIESRVFLHGLVWYIFYAVGVSIMFALFCVSIVYILPIIF